MKESVESFGHIIKTLRKQRHMTQKMLSQDICSQSVLSRIENDEELPNVWVMYQICQRLNITLDQVMMLHTEEIRKTNEIFDRLRGLFFHKKYEVLLEELHKPQLLDSLYLDTEMQMYYYFLGSCEYFLYRNYEKAIDDLKKGLSFTFQQDKTNVSPLEIRIMSCLGKVYADAKVHKEATFYLEKSYDNLKRLPQAHHTPEMVKIIYNYADFLFQEKKYEDALARIREGILFAQNKNSFYYLEELFDLQGQVYLKIGKPVQAADSFELCEFVIKIQKNKEMV